MFYILNVFRIIWLSLFNVVFKIQFELNLVRFNDNKQGENDEIKFGNIF